MKLVDQWRTIEANLPPGWEDVRLRLTTEQPSDLSRAANVLTPINVGKSGSALVFHVHGDGGAQGSTAASRLFARLDHDRTWCHLEQTSVQVREREDAPVPDAGPSSAEASTAVSWDEAVAPLSADWTDLLCELELTSSDELDRVALLCAPLNPTRDPDRLAFTFRCSGRSGYGVSRSMARRCFERLDNDGIVGVVKILRALSDTDNVDTQGPVWLVAGKSV